MGKKIVINGLFLTQKTTGIQRFAYEIVRELDALVAGQGWEVLVPNQNINYPKFQNIKLVRYGKCQGLLWEQVCLPWYLSTRRAYGVHLCNVVPLGYANGVAAIHDISYKVNPQFFVSARDKISALWHRLQYWRVKHSKCTLITVSAFSKLELEKVYKILPSRIHVVYSAWQHMLRLKENAEALSKYDKVKPFHYYFSLATLAKNKNIDWLLKAAKAYPKEQFLVAGGGREVVSADSLPPNIYFLGYVPDEDAKALMHTCKAFVFPTFYEGFGLPPLEAVAAGARHIIVSDTPCMHEVYGDHASYVDPYKEVLPSHNASVEGLLDRYSWKTSSRKVYEVINGI